MAERRSLRFPFGRSTPVADLGPLESKDAPTRRASAGPQFVSSGRPYVSTWDVNRVVRDGYEKVIPVFAAVDKIADVMSSWPIDCMQGSEPDWKKVTDEPALELLNVRANRIDGNARGFRYRLVSQLLLSKKGVFIEVVPSRGGKIAALNLLPPGLTYPVPDADNWLSGFEVHLPNGDRQTMPEYDPAKKAGVLWIRKPHPIDPYMSVTPLEAAGISIDLDFYARLYNRNFLLNDGRAGQLVAVKGGLSDEDARELKARFSPGMGGAGRTTVIEADAVSVQDTAVSPRDAQYAELRNITIEDILMALGTPKSVLGNATGVTFDNADAEKENWLDATVLPLSAVVESGLDVLTDGGWDDNRQFRHNTENVPVLQRMRFKKIDRAAADYDAGRIPLETYLEVAGYDAMDVPGARVAWLNVQNRAPIGLKDEDVAAAAELKMLAPAAPAGGLPGAVPGEPAPVPLDGATPGAVPAPAAPPSPGGDPTVAGPDGAAALVGASGLSADRLAAKGLPVSGLAMLLELKEAVPPDVFAQVLEDLEAADA